ncbi:hypothetical protein ACFOWX_03080 [Sphingorhabdus arenilitoris]|uniref:Uncharacterized protein n=1 Tax=Sphingorhabdus arenilitoris TaxID=1490041 RepID=A0ABV8RDA2_9SPHN
MQYISELYHKVFLSLSKIPTLAGFSRDKNFTSKLNSCTLITVYQISFFILINKIFEIITTITSPIEKNHIMILAVIAYMINLYVFLHKKINVEAGNDKYILTLFFSSLVLIWIAMFLIGIHSKEFYQILVTQY